MQIECLISYTDPEGKRYERGQVYQVDAEDGLWLMVAAEGQFRVVDTDAATAEILADVVEQPPADRMVRRAPRSRGR